MDNLDSKLYADPSNRFRLNKTLTWDEWKEEIMDQLYKEYNENRKEMRDEELTLGEYIYREMNEFLKEV